MLTCEKIIVKSNVNYQMILECKSELLSDISAGPNHTC